MKRERRKQRNKEKTRKVEDTKSTSDVSEGSDGWAENDCTWGIWLYLTATFPHTKTCFSQSMLFATLPWVEGRKRHVYYVLNTFVRNPAAAKPNGWILPPFPLLVAVVEVSPLLYSAGNFHKACRNLIILETSAAQPNVGWNNPQFRKGYGTACQPPCLKKLGWKCGGKTAQNQKTATLLITITIKPAH